MQSLQNWLGVVVVCVTLAFTQEASAQALRASENSLSLSEVVRLGTDDLNDFWSREFIRAGWTYTSPHRLYPYRSTYDAACGPTLLNNATYCPADHSIYYDADFLARIYATPRFGDFGTLTILAHEWGHAVQRQLAAALVPTRNMNRELQADCFAGAYGGFLDTRQSERLVLEEGDLEEGATFLYAIGDDLPWFDENAHGSPYDRSLRFVVGQSEGTGACYPNSQYRDADGAFSIGYPRTWQIRRDNQWSQDGQAYHKSFLMAPQRAEQAILHGYLSEGIRINMELPPRGRVWTADYQKSWATDQIDGVLRANPEFRLTGSRPTDWLPGAMRYWIEGGDSLITEPERTSIVVVSDPRFLLLVELASPASRYDYYTHRLDDLLRGFEILDPRAPLAAR